MNRIFLVLTILTLVVGMAGFAHAEKKIQGKPVEYSAQGVTMKGYLAYDENIKGKRPGVLVVHEWWGQNEYVRKRARMLAELGYTALALDMYGGDVVLNMALQGADLRGVASFHGSLSAVKPAQAGAAKAKILVLNGADDKFITAEQIEAIKQEMKKAGADFQFINYPGVVHSFTNPQADEVAKKFNMAVGYNAEADKKSWEELKKFLEGGFKK